MPRLRTVVAFILGVVVGGAVNMALIKLSPSLVPPPAGVDVTNAESIASGIHLFEPRHFIMPFLAHALGTLVGALVAYTVATLHRTGVALGVGGFFLLGGIASIFMIPAPAWFIALDLLVAYIPMAWLGARLGAKVSRSPDQLPAAA